MNREPFKELQGGITAVRGVRAAGVHCGIKKAKPDVALIRAADSSVVAGVFTTNRVKAAPVLWCQRRMQGGRLSAIVVNSGNANACTGIQGLKDAETMASLGAAAVGCPESSKELDQLKSIYKQAYYYFERERYVEAKREIQNGLQNYADTEFFSKLKLLNVLITGKTENIIKYKSELDNFINEYPDSEVTPYAKELIVKADNFQENYSTTDRIRYLPKFDQTHYFILLYNSDLKKQNELSWKLEDFNESFFQDLDLQTGNLVFDDSHSMILVNDFSNKEQATKFYDYFKAESKLRVNYPNTKFYNFVISKDNFEIFYRSKDLNTYLTFFDSNY